MAGVLAVSVASLDYMPEAGERSENLLREIVSRLEGLASLPEKSGKRIVTSLNDAERVSIEAKRYAAILALTVTDKTARLLYALATRSEKPLILVVTEDGWGFPDALDAYNMLRSSGIGVSPPLAYPRDLEEILRYVRAASRLSGYQGAALIMLGSTPVWSLYSSVNEVRFRTLLDAAILRLDINDVVLRFEEVSASEARRIYEESLPSAEVEADIDLLVNELRLYVTLSRIARENRAMAVAANCAELIGKFGGVYLAASLLAERDSTPLACNLDSAAAVTASLLSLYGRPLIAQPRSIKGDQALYELLYAPLSILERPRVVFNDRLSALVLTGEPRIEGKVTVARLDPELEKLYAVTCEPVATYPEPLPSLELSGCTGVETYPGARHVLLPGVERDELGYIARLLGLRLVTPRREE